MNATDEISLHVMSCHVRVKFLTIFIVSFCFLWASLVPTNRPRYSKRSTSQLGIQYSHESALPVQCILDVVTILHPSQFVHRERMTATCSVPHCRVADAMLMLYSVHCDLQLP